MHPTFLAEKFSIASDYAAYLATGTTEQQRRWTQVYDLATVSPAQTDFISTFVRTLHVLVVSGIWCGDCVQQVPLVQRLADANPSRVKLRILDRDAHKDLSSMLKINGGDRVPVVLLLSEDFEPCATLGDRTLSRYRAIALRQLGASCATGIGGPDVDEMKATQQDWLNELERVQLMLRISPRLRMKYGD